MASDLAKPEQDASSIDVPDVKLYGHETYKDVTQDIFKAASQLKVGELAADEEGELSKVIHALEIGSDKIDTGLNYFSLQEDLSTAPRIETSDDAMGFMDALLSREMSWHSGFSLMQNVLSCVYVEEILTDIYRRSDSLPVEGQKHSAGVEELLTDAADVKSWSDVAKVYILATIKSIDLASKVMGRATALYQEEDIQLGNAGFLFLETTPKDRIISVLKKALSWVKQQEVPQIKYRLELRQNYMHILADGLKSSTAHISNAQKLISQIEPRIDETQFEGAFSIHIQSRVTNTAPPRSLVGKGENGYEPLKNIIDGHERLSNVTSLTRATDALAFFLTFSASRPRALPIVRARLQSTLTQAEFLDLSFREWVRKDMVEMTCGAYDKCFGPTAKPEVFSLITLFLDQAALCYGDLLIGMCQNRSRQRQSLAHCIVSFDSLQVSAEALELELAKNGIKDTLIMPDKSVADALPISSWVYLRKLNVMIWVALLGFELETYKLWEFPRMYYYCQYLLAELNNQLARVQHYLSQKVRTCGNPQQVNNALQYLHMISLESCCLEELCGASFLIALSFDKFRLIKDHPTNPVTSEELMYKLRMKPFSSVGVPEAPSYQEYCAAISQYKNAKDLALLAKTKANKCKKMIEGLTTMLHATNPELDLLKRSSVGIFVSASMLEKNHKGNGIAKKDGFHWFFPVLNVEA